MPFFSESVPWFPSSCLASAEFLGFFAFTSYEKKQKKLQKSPKLWSLILAVLKPIEKRADLLLNSDNKQLMPDSSCLLEKEDRQRQLHWQLHWLFFCLLSMKRAHNPVQTPEASRICRMVVRFQKGMRKTMK